MTTNPFHSIVAMNIAGYLIHHHENLLQIKHYDSPVVLQILFLNTISGVVLCILQYYR